VTSAETFFLVLALWFGFILVVFPGEMARVLRLLSRWPSSGMDGVHMGAGEGHRHLYVVFDPPWWKLARWAWWLRAVRVGIPTGKVLLSSPLDGKLAEFRIFEKQATWKLDRFRRKHAE
jgi:hypothetical protein